MIAVNRSVYSEYRLLGEGNYEEVTNRQTVLARGGGGGQKNGTPGLKYHIIENEIKVNMIVEFLNLLYVKVKFYFPKTIQHREIPHRTLQQKCDKYMKSFLRV